MDSGVSSEKSVNETDVVPNKISKESANLDFSTTLLPQPPPVLQNDPVLYHHDYNCRFSNLSMNSHSSEPYTRWSAEIRHPPRGILATGVRRCGTVAGGSPFVACCKCYELLQVPKKKTKKIRCAACSKVMLLSFINKRLILSVYTEPNIDPGKSKYDHKTRRDAKWGGTEYSSEDYDNSRNFDFESMDKLSLRGPNLTSYKSAILYTSEDEIRVNIILDDDRDGVEDGPIFSLQGKRGIEDEER